MDTFAVHAISPYTNTASSSSDGEISSRPGPHRRTRARTALLLDELGRGRRQGLGEAAGVPVRGELADGRVHGPLHALGTGRAVGAGRHLGTGLPGRDGGLLVRGVVGRVGIGPGRDGA